MIDKKEIVRFVKSFWSLWLNLTIFTLFINILLSNILTETRSLEQMIYPAVKSCLGVTIAFMIGGKLLKKLYPTSKESM